GLVEVGLDLLEDPLLVFREWHAIASCASAHRAPPIGVQIIVARCPTPLNAPAFHDHPGEGSHGAGRPPAAVDWQARSTSRCAAIALPEPGYPRAAAPSRVNPSRKT